jgi:D-alanyl-D-alanine carboxypeptidase
VAKATKKKPAETAEKPAPVTVDVAPETTGSAPATVQLRGTMPPPAAASFTPQ